MKISKQSIAKDSAFLSEDAILTRWMDETLLTGLADGAGGEGLFAGEWAKNLLYHLPAQPIESFSAFRQWIAGQWQAFYDDWQARATELSPKHHEKFVEEGSGSTLVAAWTNPSGALNYISYGDSLLLMYNHAEDRLSVDPWVLRACTRQPFLINWLHEPKEAAFLVSRVHLLPGNCLILASDAIGQYLLAAYLAAKRQVPFYQSYYNKVREQPNRFSQLLDALLLTTPASGSGFRDVMAGLLAALETGKEFRQYTENLKKKQWLSPDDYSVICVEY